MVSSQDVKVFNNPPLSATRGATMVSKNGSLFKLFAGNSNPELAQDIAKHLGMELGKATVGRFPNGEIHIEILEPVRGHDVYVIQSISTPGNDYIMELMLLFDALKRASARSITAIVPYFGYGKQDKRKTGREPVSAKVVADMFTIAGIDRLITFDLHARQIEAFFDIPVDNFPTVSFFCKHFEKNKPKDLVIVSPDAGRLKTARKYAGMLGCKIAVVDKYRQSFKEARVEHLLGDVEGKHALIIDDMIDTGGTICAAAETVMKHGAKSVSICATHAILTDPAVERLSKLGIKVVVADTVAIPKEKQFKGLKVLSMGPLLAEIIQRIQGREPLSPLFEPVTF